MKSNYFHLKYLSNKILSFYSEFIIHTYFICLTLIILLILNIYTIIYEKELLHFMIV